MRLFLINIESENDWIAVCFRWFDHIVTNITAWVMSHELIGRELWSVRAKTTESDLIITQVVFLFSARDFSARNRSPKLDSTELEIYIGRWRWVHSSVKASAWALRRQIPYLLQSLLNSYTGSHIGEKYLLTWTATESGPHSPTINEWSIPFWIFFFLHCWCWCGWLEGDVDH